MKKNLFLQRIRFSPPFPLFSWIPHCFFENGRNVYRISLALIFVFLLGDVARAQTPSWNETARTWEESARRFTELADTVAAREAWAQAATAWERDGRLRATAASTASGASSDYAHLNELEEAVSAVTAELASWRQTAIAWRNAARIWSSGNSQGASDASQMASERAKTALAKVAELEDRLAELSTKLNQRRATLIDMPVSAGLQSELIDRWVLVALSWEMTALTWDRSNEPGKARISRIKADQARQRIRELRSDVSDTWLREKTYPASSVVEAPEPAAELSTVVIPAHPELVDGEHGLAGSPQAGISGPEIPPVTVPEIPPSPGRPPDWLLSKEERESLKNASIWRQSAEAWRKTALSRVADRDWESASDAVFKMREAMSRATSFENSVRQSYAKREAEISNQVAKALGEPPRSETDVLTVLDASGALSLMLLPPTVTGDAIALAPPPLPEALAPHERRGFFDLEIGGPLPSTLTIRGRKVVDVNYSVTHFPHADANRIGGNTQSSFNLNQELQVEVLGRVGREDNDHININIRYDDTQRGVNSVNNRQIAVNFITVPHKASWGTYYYHADFGDISVSLPGSEFAFYNKSLFGVTGNFSVTDLNYGPFKADRVALVLIGSQTKGVSASKEFSLTGERKVEEIKDVNFSRNRFFLVEPAATTLPISQVTVYKDDQIGSNNQGTLTFTASGAGPTAGFSHAGNWNVLAAGIDYVLNQSTGELEILSGLDANHVLAVTYNNSGGGFFGTGGTAPRLIKVASDTSAAARAAFRVHEFRNHYKLERSRIKKDDPKFVFEIRDALGSAQTSNVGGVPTTYLRLFGFDRDANDKVDVELVDYDFGVIRPIDTAPFARTGNPAVDNTALYSKNDVTEADQKYTIHIEYSSDQPQEIFTLGFDIIKASDIVYVDGVKVTRDVDYFIDYEAGVITFLNRAIIKPESKIRVDYEFLPFGGQLERTLVGSRLDVDVNSKLSFGTTLLYDFSAAATEIPSIFEDKPNKNAIVELDARLQVAPLFYDLLDRAGHANDFKSLRQNFRLDVNGEWAWATHSPNTFGSAMLEDFEAIENILSASFSRTSWALASLPPDDTPVNLGLSQGTRGSVGFNTADNFGHRTTAQVQTSERQQSLKLDISFAAGETWVAIRQPLSSAAINFNDITSMELFASGLPASIRMFADVGLISEDADGDGVLETEDNGLDGKPNTNDPGENNGVLNSGEDIGIDFHHPIRGTEHVGGGDGALTTEDMNGNSKLDQNEAFFRLGEFRNSQNIERKNFFGLNNSAWTVFRAPWRTGTPFNGADSSVIKHLRLIFIRADGADTSFTVFMDQLNFRGNRFTGSSADSRITLSPRNNENDPNYVSPPRSELKANLATTKEQALGIKWSLSANDSAIVIQKLAKKIDLGDYKRLSYFVAGDRQNETFSLFMVSDPDNYIEIRRAVTTGSDVGGILGPPALPLWERIDVLLDPIRQVTIANILGKGDSIVTIEYPGYTVLIVGQPTKGLSPSLANITQIWLKIQNGPAADTGEIWLDDLYAAEPINASATAQKASFATGWADIWSLSGSWRDVPGKFHGVGFINNPQAGTFDEISNTSKSLSATLALHRLLPSSWQLVLPISASWSQNTMSVDPDRVENTLKSTLGKTQSDAQSYNTTFQFWRFPALNLSYGRTSSVTDYRLEDRTANTANFNGSTSYAYVFPRKLFGIIPTGEALSLNAGYNFSDARAKSSYAAISGLQSTNRRDAAQSANFALSARPINPLSLSYNFQTALVDQRSLIPSERYKGMTNRNHSTNATLSLPTMFGISPGLSFSGNFLENFTRATFGGRNKDISLGGDFRMNVAVDPAVWSRFLKFLTVRYSYSLSSNAAYRGTNTGTGLTDVFNDYVGERLFPWGSSRKIGIGTQGVTKFRSSGSTNIVHNLSGDIATWPWLRTSYSSSLTRNEVASLSTLSLTDGISGTLNSSLDYNQAFPHSFIKFRSSYITGSVSYNRNENAATRSNSIAPNMNWSMGLTEALNMTMSMGYNRATSISFFSPENKSISSALSPSMNFTYYFDLKIPESLKLPGIGHIADLSRRIQIGGGANANFARATLGKKLTSNQNNYGVNLSLGYRIASNLEFSASSNGTWLQNLLEKQNDFLTIGGGARVEWRF